MTTFFKRPRWHNRYSGNVSFTVDEFSVLSVGDTIAIQHAYKGFVVRRVAVVADMINNATKTTFERHGKQVTFYLVPI